MFYRIKQFIWAITAKLSEEEIQFIKRYLSIEEQELFWGLRVYEQKHSLRVAYALRRQGGKHQVEEYIRLGLLHDVGKSKYPLNPIEKSIIVMLDGITKGRIRYWSKLKIVKCYYQHGEIGYQMLQELGSYAPSFLEAVKTHHQEEIIGNSLQMALKACDDSC